MSTVSGRRLLSTYPDVTVHSMTPEIPDPYMNSELELRGQWKSGPVVAQINAGMYELIVIKEGEAEAHEGDGYRGVRKWDAGMWAAFKRTYGLACVFRGYGGLVAQSGLWRDPSHPFAYWLSRRGNKGRQRFALAPWTDTNS